MADVILVLHAPDALKDARKLSNSLRLAGYFTYTFKDAVGSSTHGDIMNSWDVIAEYASGFIVLLSPKLLEDKFLLELVRGIVEAKKAIPVCFSDVGNIPDWMQPLPIKSNISAPDGDRFWNRLSAALNRFLDPSALYPYQEDGPVDSAPRP